MAITATDEQVMPQDIRDAEFEDPDETNDSGVVTRSFAPEIDPLEAILADVEAGQQVHTKWLWKRKNSHWPIRSLTAEEMKRINEKWTVRKIIGRTKQVHTELESEGYNIDIAIAGTMNPNFNDAAVRGRLAQKYNTKANDAPSILKRTLLIGEIYNLSEAILNATGFDTSEETTNELKS